MAGGAGLELGRRRLFRAPGNSGLRVYLPVATIGRLQPVGQPHPRVIGAASGRRLGPGDMTRAGAMARLARHVHIRPAGRIGVGGEVVVLLQIGRVAIGALVIPGLVRPGPVQSIAGRQFSVGIEVEPALAAILFLPAVPGDAERLAAPARKRDQVLLQRVDAEGVGDRILVQRAVRGHGPHQEFVGVTGKGRRDAEMLALGASKIAEHGCLCDPLHRQSVVRALPALGLGRWHPEQTAPPT